MLNKIATLNIHKYKLINSYTNNFTRHISYPKKSYILDQTILFFPEDRFLILSEIKNVCLINLFSDRKNNNKSLYKIFKNGKIFMIDKNENFIIL
jgi:hypothetical protein